MINSSNNSSKKYELTEEMDVIMGHTLHRIHALRDFADVKAGDLGGYVESEDNLSHTGNCWVYDDAQVYGNARVFDDAQIRNNASVYGDAQVFEDAKIRDYAEVFEQAKIYGKVIVDGEAGVCGTASIR